MTKDALPGRGAMSEKAGPPRWSPSERQTEKGRLRDAISNALDAGLEGWEIQGEVEDYLGEGVQRPPSLALMDIRNALSDIERLSDSDFAKAIEAAILSVEVAWSLEEKGSGR